MKNDYKIGLVIGLLVLVLGVGYFIYRGTGKAKTSETAVPTTEVPLSDSSFSGETTATDASGSGFTPPPPSVPEEPAPVAAAETETVQPAPAPETARPEAPKPAEPSLADRVDNWSNRTGNENAVRPEPAADTVAPRLNTETAAPAGNTPAAPAAGTSASGEWGIPPVAGGTTPAVAPTNTTPAPNSATATTPDTYVVQPNDVGWYIAENVYGKGMGRYWTLIRDANPTVDMSNLKKGQVLKIPALPDTVRGRMQDSAAAGTSTTDASGRRIYVTKSGDSLWTIAQTVYGKGHLYKEIQKANPGVNVLRPGLRLVIPEVAGATTTSTSADTGESTTYGSETVTSVSSSNKYYVVKSGDSLWTIAEDQYGDGAYADLIKKANPNINPNNIRVGQRLIIPAKDGNGTGTTSAEPADNGTERRRTSSPSGPVPSDEPDFGL